MVRWRFRSTQRLFRHEIPREIPERKPDPHSDWCDIVLRAAEFHKLPVGADVGCEGEEAEDEAGEIGVGVLVVGQVEDPADDGRDGHVDQGGEDPGGGGELGEFFPGKQALGNGGGAGEKHAGNDSMADKSNGKSLSCRGGEAGPGGEQGIEAEGDDGHSGGMKPVGQPPERIGQHDGNGEGDRHVATVDRQINAKAFGMKDAEQIHRNENGHPKRDGGEGPPVVGEVEAFTEIGLRGLQKSRTLTREVGGGIFPFLDLETHEQEARSVKDADGDKRSHIVLLGRLNEEEIKNDTGKKADGAEEAKKTTEEGVRNDIVDERVEDGVGHDGADFEQEPPHAETDQTGGVHPGRACAQDAMEPGPHGARPPWGR